MLSTKQGHTSAPTVPGPVVTSTFVYDGMCSVTARRNKWNLAHRITNHDPKRWTWRLLAWNPEIHFDGKICRAARKRARPQIRWTDDLDKFSEYKSENSDWITMVRDKTSWTNNAKEYSCGDWRESECSKKEI